MILAESTAHDTSVTVAIITTVGLIVVAAIGVWQVTVTNRAKTAATSAKEEAKDNAVEAATSAQMAKDYAAAMGVKDALVASLESRVNFLEEQNQKLIERLDEFERRDEEHHEQQRAAALIERDYANEIDQLRRELHLLRDHGSS